MLSEGNFFVTTGEIHIRNYDVEGAGSRRTIVADEHEALRDSVRCDGQEMGPLRRVGLGGQRRLRAGGVAVPVRPASDRLTVAVGRGINPRMQTTLSNKGQVLLPLAARRRLRAVGSERLSVELREGGVLLRPMFRARRYRSTTHPVSGLPVMAARSIPARKVSAAEIARLHAELL